MNKIAIIIILVFVQGCSNVYARLTYDFRELENDKRILYEVGAEEIASEISISLNKHISLVEKKQYFSYASLDDIKVFVFAEKNRYANYSYSSPLARGSATTNEIYISPIINDRRETLPLIMIHELSHVHIRQHIGTWRYWSEVPGWFLEGLAVEVSGGGGAEKVSDKEAIEAIKSGKHFIPRESSSILGHKYAHNYGLKPHLYYRQSNLFVRFIKESDPEAFRKSYLSLIQGEEFADIWIKYYNKTIPELWKDFLKYVKA